MRIPACAAAVAALLLLAVPARAQDAATAADTTATDTLPRTSLQKGSWSLSFAPPGYSGSGERSEFGVWEMVGARTNLGLTLAVAVYGSESEIDSGGETTMASTLVDVGVSVKRYVMAPRDVTPFVLGSAALGGRFERREADEFTETIRGMNVGARAAVGVEWFPVRRMSLSGQTGFGFQTGRYDTEQEFPDDTRREGELRSVSFNSFTSALSLHIYF